ncbi:TonB-dependent receptor [Mesonia sp. K7]|uniref:TonB-dependent receptor n=1 Tax=Mesonia sp. K7 TaxID=2218606 RepID=UPI000DA75682|nr:TonB-dependent receptor [Mesonia sp. K7]PZD77453.1 TonB-dependent receptor [Mesonia sp. K7]
MKLVKYILIFIPLLTLSQESILLSGSISHKHQPVPFANITVVNSTIGTAADINGNYQIKLTEGTHEIQVQAIGFKSISKVINTQDYFNKNLDFVLEEDLLGLEQIVISATRNRVNRQETPVVVNVLDEKLFNATQSISVAESLNFQPGVRVETNCQNCGFTQVRLNGLGGAYTQVLINNRAVFSALNSVYGLEQIPTSILDRIEVVRSGGSALYGSNAIAGTINIITKEPILNSWEVIGNMGLIDGTSVDRTLNLNASVVSEDLNSGITFFGMNRNRDSYDANRDGFSEITELTNTSLGAKAYLKPNENSKISIDLTALDEYRRGGNKLDLAPHLTDITEELHHDTYLGGLTYEINNKNQTNYFSVYTSAQHTDRKSYYGGLGGGRTLQDSIVAANAYGKTNDLAFLVGSQFTRHFSNNDMLTLGSEYNHSSTEDNIAGYNRLIDQSVNSFGTFAQYEWKPSKKFTTLLGARLDHIKVDGLYKIQQIERASAIEETVLSPRLTLGYKINDDFQLRGGYARGFRAPQAFNEDLHISAVGGEPKFVILSNDLTTEFSDAYTFSLNYAKEYKKVQTNFLLEGFYTDLKNPFTTVSTGSSLSNGSILEEVRNGNGAYVTGTNLEIGVSPSAKFLFQLGGTYQQSRYKETQILYEAENPTETNVTIDEFVRNPSVYGYLNTNFKPWEDTSIDLTGTYTGKMTVPKVVSDAGFIQLNESQAFYDLNLKLTQHFHLTKNVQMNIFGGVKNMFNSYQNDFDTGPTRDSAYIYGPALPRTFFFGLKFGNLHNR